MSLEQNITAGQSDRPSFIKRIAAAPLFETIGSRVDHLCFSGGKGFRGLQCSEILMWHQRRI